MKEVLKGKQVISGKSSNKQTGDIYARVGDQEASDYINQKNEYIQEDVETEFQEYHPVFKEDIYVKRKW